METFCIESNGDFFYIQDIQSRGFGVSTVFGCRIRFENWHKDVYITRHDKYSILWRDVLVKEN